MGNISSSLALQYIYVCSLPCNTTASKRNALPSDAFRDLGEKNPTTSPIFAAFVPENILAYVWHTEYVNEIFDGSAEIFQETTPSSNFK